MKAVQVMMDEELLREIDADAQVRKSGRSALFRRLAADYLAGRRRIAVAERYRAAYGAGEGLGGGFEGWEEEGAWPET
jgi:metal-responsive CopG/Arc/MetJ family transcriptional regulator